MALSLMAFLGGIIGIQGLLQGLLYTYPPYISGRARDTYRQEPNVLPSVDQLIGATYKGEMSYAEYINAARELGLESAWAEKVFDAARRQLDGADYVAAWRRELITESELVNALEGLHFNDQDIDRLKAVTEYYPPVPDLIRFAVREVYNATVRKQFGADEDITQEYIEAAAKAGLPEEQARNYWASHWQLPSVQQGFEMLHRGVITPEQLQLLLRALDIMPFWRDALTRISYNPLTRVDVRRMHAMGVLDDEETLQAYKDIGYDDVNAKRMLDFTIQYNSSDEKGLTRASVTKAYVDDIITEDELRLFLQSFGYSEDTINFYIAQANFDKREDDLNEKKANLSLKYKLGGITLEEYRNELGIIGVPATYIDKQIRAEKDQDAQKLKMPTKADLESWFDKRIITEEYYVEMMRRIGYRDEDITHYLTDLTMDREEEEEKYLGLATYQRWLKKGLIDEQSFRGIAQGMDVHPDDIELLVAEAIGE